MTESAKDRQSEEPPDGPRDGPWRAADDGVLARGMRAEADDATYEAAWREFDRRHLGPLRGFVRAKGAALGRDTCEDLVQESVVRVQQHVHGFEARGDGSLRSWCFKIANNVVLDALRGRRCPVSGAATRSGDAVELVSFDEVAERYLDDGPHAGEELDAFSAAAPDAEPAMLTPREQVMREAFESLSPVDQAVLWGTVVRGDSDQDIAGVVDKPVDHVRKIRHKALGKLGRAFRRLRDGLRRAS